MLEKTLCMGPKKNSQCYKHMGTVGQWPAGQQTKQADTTEGDDSTARGKYSNIRPQDLGSVKGHKARSMMPQVVRLGGAQIRKHID